MEKAFIKAWLAARSRAAELGVRMRPVTPEDALQTAHRILSGRRPSDGFSDLTRLGHEDCTLEALVLDPRFTGLFTDEEANEAIARLMETDYFRKLLR